MARKPRIKKTRKIVRSVSRERQKRREAFAKQPAEVRMAALPLLPQSRRQVGRKIGKQRRKVIRLRSAALSASDPVTRQELSTKLSTEIKTLAGLVATAHKKRQRALRGGMSGVTKISKAQAKTRFSHARARLAKIGKTLKILSRQQKNQKGSDTVQAHRRNQISILLLRQIHSKRRLALLSRGLDFDRPVKLSPARVAVQRKKLTLPRAWSVPSQPDTIVMVRLLGTQVKRLRGESNRQFIHRLRAYAQRSMIRFLNLRASRIAVPAAIRGSVEATMAEDKEALDAEAAAGGVVADEMAESMDDLLQPVADQLEAAAEDFQVEVPEGDPSPEELEEILDSAAEAEADAMAAPVEPADEMEEDLFAAEEVFAPDQDELDEEISLSDDTGIKPIYIIGGIGILGALLFLSGK